MGGGKDILAVFLGFLAQSKSDYCVIGGLAVNAYAEPLQTHSRYQDFLRRSKIKDVLGYKMKVAAVEDVLQGKIWAYSDTTRHASKRQKDLADILRLAENYPDLKKFCPRDES